MSAYVIWFQLSHHALHTEKTELKVCLIDTTGLSSDRHVGMHDEDIPKTLAGQIPDGYPVCIKYYTKHFYGFIR